MTLLAALGDVQREEYATRVVVTGGGSGGHAMPAFATIDRLRETDGLDVAYIGSQRGIEREIAARAGLGYHAIRTGKLRRSRRWYGLLTRRNAADLLGVLVGVGQSHRLLARLRPSVVLATGGFVTVPVVWAARLRRIPVVIHEQTVQFGLANRLCAPAATRIALSTGLSSEGMRPAWRDKSTITGNPVRAGILTGDAARGRERFGLAPGLPTVFVTGGALGSETVNRALLDALPDLLSFCKVVHQCGVAPGLTTNYEKLAAAAIGSSAGTYTVAKFVEADAMGDAYAMSSLVVCRSGAGTTNELAAAGRAAVLVPLVPTGGDEQRRIAHRFARAGAAIVVPDEDLTGWRLATDAHELLADRDRLTAMQAAARALAPGDAAHALAQLVLQTARRRHHVTPAS
jgi:UDP-N-acetylglucosamine--N-acetylmuramyl-(pentapeptide) pyrophosphoryl-undecaprenol N-acetylglucosamine transferase